MNGFILVLIASFIWALDSLIRYPLVSQGISSFQIVLGGHLVLTLMYGKYFFQNIKKFQFKDLFYFLFIGGVGSACATLAFTQAFTYMNPSLVIILQKLQPLVAIILAWYLLGEKISKSFLIGALICLFGAVLIAYDDFKVFWENIHNLDKLFYTAQYLRGYLLVLFAVVGWGASTVIGKKLLTLNYDSKHIMSGRFVFGFMCLLPFVFFQRVPFNYEPLVLFKIGFIEILSGAIALSFYYKGLRKINARACAIGETFFPVFAIILNWIFLHKSILPIQVVGTFLLLLGSTLIQWFDRDES